MKQKQELEEIRAKYKNQFQKIAKILFDEDPAGINFEVNEDEYENEVGTILPRLDNCGSIEDVRRIVQEEFIKWFDRTIAGPEEKYQRIAVRIWTEVIEKPVRRTISVRYAAVGGGDEPDLLFLLVDFVEEAPGADAETPGIRCVFRELSYFRTEVGAGPELGIEDSP